MNTNETTTTQNSTRTRLVVLFVLFFLSTLGMFGQTTNTVAASTITFETSVASNDDTITTASTTTTAVEANTSMNMVSWFMGTKQTAKNNMNTGDVDFSKKQMINSGTAPNRLLMKAFLKKAASYQSTIA